MTVEDRLLEGVYPDTLERIWRVGLNSVWLFVRDREGPSLLAEVALRGLRVGEGSREACGDCEIELVPDECADF